LSHRISFHFYSFSFFQSYDDPLHLHSFPTRRSSDLFLEELPRARDGLFQRRDGVHGISRVRQDSNLQPPDLESGALAVRATDPRSEEHTSELQSRVDLVCRLLLEKKKTKRKNYNK